MLDVHVACLWLLMLLSGFRELGDKLHTDQMTEARKRIKELKEKDPNIDLLKLPDDLLLALVFYTVNSEPINPKMRDMWKEYKIDQPLECTPDQKFAIAASILLQSCIMREPSDKTKWNLKRNTRNYKIQRKDMPFRCPTSCAQEEQSQFGDEKAILRTRVGLSIEQISKYPNEREVLLPIGYSGKIVSDEGNPTTVHSEDVSSPSDSHHRDAGSKLYQDNLKIYVRQRELTIAEDMPHMLLYDGNLPYEVARVVSATTKETSMRSLDSVKEQYHIS